MEFISIIYIYTHTHHYIYIIGLYIYIDMYVRLLVDNHVQVADNLARGT